MADTADTRRMGARGSTRTSESEGRTSRGEKKSSDESSPQSEATRSEIDFEEFVRDNHLSENSEPGFTYINGEISDKGYNKTTVDIITVPCIGASPLDTWARDPLKEDYFGVPSGTELEKYPTARELPASSILSPTINRPLPKAGHVWTRQGIRKEVSTARIMLYRHRGLSEGMTLDQAAEDLLQQVRKQRAGLKKSRPVFFICHSIGGLVVKMALVKANEREELKSLVYDCHGITFFATPHKGSSYMSMPHLRESIRHLLFLEAPLPMSIAHELRLGHKPLLKMHEKFTDFASEICIWTFYETIDSQLSGLGGSDFDEVHFSAPLTSIKSGLLGTRSEKALSLESDHAHCASFGPNNLRTMHSYLGDLAQAVRKAEYLSASFEHTPLRLKEKVKLELIGFYEDPDNEASSDLRLYVSGHKLFEFLQKGPEKCLQERLLTVAAKLNRQSTLPPSRRLTTAPSRPSALGIWNNMQELGQRLLNTARPDSSHLNPEEEADKGQSPEIVVTSHSQRPSITGVMTEPLPSVPTPRSRGLRVPSLATTGSQHPSSRDSSAVRSSGGTTARTASDPVITDVSAKTIAEQTVHSGPSGVHDPISGTDETDHFHERQSRQERLSRASALQDMTAGFSRPNPNNRKFMWIHLPFNNPQWVKNIFGKLSETRDQNLSRLLNNEHWFSRHVQGRHTNLHASYVKAGCAFVPTTANSPRPSSSGRSGRSASPAAVSPSHFYLYLPYLHYDTYVNIVRRRNVVRRRLNHGRARPVPKDIAELESLESRVIWEYIGDDPPLNARRTLDQYGYPSLRDTYARDDDQMLYKLTKERIALPLKRDMYHAGEDRTPLSAVSPAGRFVSIADTLMKSGGSSSSSSTDSELEEDILDGNVLMVDQLWLWAVDTTTLMTCFPKRESHPTEGPLFQQADLRNSVYNELNGDLTGRCDNALDLAAFIALHAVTVLLERTSHPDLEIFRIFDEAIGILTERMTSSLKRFRMQTFKDRIHDDSDADPSEEDNRSASIKRRHKREIEQAERENRENTSALLELRDMEDELNTLRILFLEQRNVIEAMKKNYEKPELQAGTECGRRFLAEALERLDEYLRQTHDMLERVETTRKDYEKLQEMVQRQAQVDEVRWSRLQAELASTQNLSVIIFTTFTVIFLPLSFFTSLFGMNTEEWGGEGGSFLSLTSIGAVSLPSSAFVIIVTLALAFSSRLQAFFKSCFKFLRSGLASTKDQVAKLRPRASTQAAKLKQRQIKETHERRARRRQEKGYDFWGNVRVERTKSDYEIPESNRRKATRQMLQGGPGKVGTWRRMVRDAY